MNYKQNLEYLNSLKEPSDLDLAFNLFKTFYGQHKGPNYEPYLSICKMIENVFNTIDYEYTREDAEEAREEDYLSCEEFFEELNNIFPGV